MNKEQLLKQAGNIAVQLRNEERKNINPYASFAAQIVALIQKGQASSKDEIIRFTGAHYSRTQMNRQWRTFNSVLQKQNLPKDRESLIHLFGYLKVIITIEGKRELEDRRREHKTGYFHGRKNFSFNKDKNS